MNKGKVCISTYCEWSSYGSVMQSLALKKALLSIGFDSFIVKDSPAPLSQTDFPFSFSKSPKALLRSILDLRYRKSKQDLYRKCVAYINRHIDIRYFNDYETLKENIPHADHYLAGSDQIWNPALCKKTFFLDFLDTNTRRLSYAVSMGTLQTPPEKEDVFKAMVSSFYSVSVREKEMVDVIQALSKKPVAVHIDPTFLIDSTEWRTLETEYLLKKPYILVYAIYWKRDLDEHLKALHKKTGYDIVALCPHGRQRIWANKKIYDADPSQFLYLVDHAEAVVSSSFHGVAFALNFNKKVAAVINPKAPSRLNTLLDTLGVKATLISDVMDFNLNNYKQINQKIVCERDRSISYLKEILKTDE